MNMSISVEPVASPTSILPPVFSALTRLIEFMSCIIEASSARAARARCELSRFQSLPSSATVRSSPSGTKTGSKPKPSLPLSSSAIRPSRTPVPRCSAPSGEIATSSQT